MHAAVLVGEHAHLDVPAPRELVAQRLGLASADLEHLGAVAAQPARARPQHPAHDLEAVGAAVVGHAVSAGRRSTARRATSSLCQRGTYTPGSTPIHGSQKGAEPVIQASGSPVSRRRCATIRR